MHLGIFGRSGDLSRVLFEKEYTNLSDTPGLVFWWSGRGGSRMGVRGLEILHLGTLQADRTSETFHSRRGFDLDTLTPAKSCPGRFLEFKIEILGPVLELCGGGRSFLMVLSRKRV